MPVQYDPQAAQEALKKLDKQEGGKDEILDASADSRLELDADVDKQAVIDQGMKDVEVDTAVVTPTKEGIGVLKKDVETGEMTTEILTEAQEKEIRESVRSMARLKEIIQPNTREYIADALAEYERKNGFPMLDQRSNMPITVDTVMNSPDPAAEYPYLMQAIGISIENSPAVKAELEKMDDNWFFTDYLVSFQNMGNDIKQEWREDTAQGHAVIDKAKSIHDRMDGNNIQASIKDIIDNEVMNMSNKEMNNVAGALGVGLVAKKFLHMGWPGTLVVTSLLTGGVVTESTAEALKKTGHMAADVAWKGLTLPYQMQRKLKGLEEETVSNEKKDEGLRNQIREHLKDVKAGDYKRIVQTAINGGQLTDEEIIFLARKKAEWRVAGDQTNIRKGTDLETKELNAKLSIMEEFVMVDQVAGLNPKQRHLYDLTVNREIANRKKLREDAVKQGRDLPKLDTSSVELTTNGVKNSERIVVEAKHAKTKLNKHHAPIKESRATEFMKNFNGVDVLVQGFLVILGGMGIWSGFNWIKSKFGGETGSFFSTEGGLMANLVRLGVLGGGAWAGYRILTGEGIIPQHEDDKLLAMYGNDEGSMRKTLASFGFEKYKHKDEMGRAFVKHAKDMAPGGTGAGYVVDRLRDDATMNLKFKTKKEEIVVMNARKVKVASKAGEIEPDDNEMGVFHFMGEVVDEDGNRKISDLWINQNQTVPTLKIHREGVPDTDVAIEYISDAA